MSGTQSQATVAERLIARIAGLEAQVANLQLNVGDPSVDAPIPPDSTYRGLSESLTSLRERMEEFERLHSTPGSIGNRPPQIMSPKDIMPTVLDSKFKERWREWSYKARDYLSQ